jgi:hypothetical protein
MESIPNIDYIILASTPQKKNIIGGDKDSIISVRKLRNHIKSSTLIQVFGDINRKVFEGLNVNFFPKENVEKGHMGVLQSYCGPLANIKLFIGSLKAAQLVNDLRKQNKDVITSIRYAVNEGFGTELKPEIKERY